MAPKRPSPEDAGQRRRRGEKHGWLALSEYVRIHETALDNSSFVVQNETSFEEVRDRALILLSGRVVCAGGVVVEVEKTLESRPSRRRRGREIRGILYKYRAFIEESGANIIRYQNCHDLNAVPPPCVRR